MPAPLDAFPRRTVHLDFHTGPAVPDVGRDFDADSFARTFADAHVDSVTVFAKCHHGMLYYDTDRPERHPGLPRNLDLLGQQIEALHAVGIRAPIYLSVQVDEWAANEHPEWVALDADLRQAGNPRTAFEPGWRTLDMSSPYQEHLYAQVSEVLQRYGPVDGIFLDMCWDQESTSRWAIAGMRQRGLDPAEPADRAAYARAVAQDYMGRFQALVEPALAAGVAQGVWFNSRPKTRLHIEKRFLRHVEIESLPTGGWGYAYFPYVSRFVRPLRLPTLSHTGRFHKSWGDNGAIKPTAALLYECTQVLSQGMTTGIGDLLHPRGVPDSTVYSVVGQVYAHVEACEPYVRGGTVVSEIAVLMPPDLGDAPGPAGIGAVRALQQLRQQFDVLPPDGDLSAYRVVIVPEVTPVDDALAARLGAHLDDGGAVLACAAALAGHHDPLQSRLAVALHGPSPYSHVFLRPQGALADAVQRYDTVMYERTVRATAEDGGEVLCTVVEPYFERTYEHFSGHAYTPPAAVSPYAAVIRNGAAVTFAAPLFHAFAEHANVPYRQIIGGVLDLLLPEPLLRDNGPSHLETSVVRVGESTVVHLLSFIPTTAAPGLELVTDPVPVVDLELRVRCDSEPTRVRLQPTDEPVEFNYDGRYVKVVISFGTGHTMLVID